MSERRRFSWGHVNVNVRDLERAISFYEELGFAVFLPGIPYLDLVREGDPRCVPEEAAGALGISKSLSGRACIMQLDDGFPKLDLTEWTAERPATPATNGDLGPVRICLATSDLAAEYERLAGAGVPFLSPPRPMPGGLADLAICTDPDGTMIELIEIHPDKWR